MNIFVCFNCGCATKDYVGPVGPGHGGGCPHCASGYMWGPYWLRDSNQQQTAPQVWPAQEWKANYS